MSPEKIFLVTKKNNKMKNRMSLIALISLVFTGIFGFSCGQNTKDALNDPSKQKEIFETISSDHNLMTKFMEIAKTNEHAKIMIMEVMTDIAKNDTTFGNKMCRRLMDNDNMVKMMMDNMMSKAGKDTTFAKNMCKKMMDDPKMKNMMGSMMGNMKDMKKDMKDMKGMDDMKNDGTDKKKDENTDKQDDHSKHH